MTTDHKGEPQESIVNGSENGDAEDTVVIASSQPEVPEEEQFAPEPSTDEELALQEIEPASIEAPEPTEPATPADKLADRAKGYSPGRVRKIVESLLLVSESPLSLDQMTKASGIGRSALLDALGDLM